MAEKIRCPDAIKKLIKHYERHRSEFLRDQYHQIILRRELIHPFFRALGWSIDSKDDSDLTPYTAGVSAPYIDRDFRIQIGRLFIVDTKRPWASIYQDADSAYQLRKKGWEDARPVNILTNFEEFAIYNCTKRPRYTDKSSTGRVRYYTYRDYEKKWSEITSIISRDAVLQGSFDRFKKPTKGKKGKLG